MQFSKTLHWDGGRAVEICCEQPCELKKWNRRKQSYMFAFSHGNYLWETTEWGCVVKMYLQVTVKCRHQKREQG